MTTLETQSSAFEIITRRALRKLQTVRGRVIVSSFRVQWGAENIMGAICYPRVTVLYRYFRDGETFDIDFAFTELFC